MERCINRCAGIVCVGLVLAGLGKACLAWNAGVPPEGHIESLYSVGLATAGYFSDADVLLSTFTNATLLYGTAHRGYPGITQAAADARLSHYDVLVWSDVDMDGTADAGDEPSSAAATSLSASLSAVATAVSVYSTGGWATSGFALVDEGLGGEELVSYSGITSSSLTGLVRGYNEYNGATHDAGSLIRQVQAWQLVQQNVMASGQNVFGYDAAQGTDGGSEGDLLQGAGAFTPALGFYLLRLRIVDSAGNTNQMVSSVDMWKSWGTNAYTTGNGNVAMGMEDDEVVNMRKNRPPVHD